MKEWYDHLYRFSDLDPELQAKIYQAYYQHIYRDIYYLFNEHPLTEDLIQESFLRILYSVNNYQVEYMLPWIKQVSHRVALDYLRKTKIDRVAIDVDDIGSNETEKELICRQPQVQDEVVKKIRNEFLHQAITELRPEYKKLILLFYIEQMSYKEIAKALRLNEGAVSQRLYRARQKLMHHFQQKW